MRGQARHAVHRRGAAQVGLPLLSKSYTKESIKVRPRLAAAGIAQTWELCFMTAGALTWY